MIASDSVSERALCSFRSCGRVAGVAGVCGGRGEEVCVCVWGGGLRGGGGGGAAKSGILITSHRFHVYHSASAKSADCF